MDDSLNARRQEIIQQCNEMVSCLVDPVENLARIDDFPMIENPSTCQRCSYYEACYKTRKIDGM
jgi:hypothetical protein